MGAWLKEARRQREKRSNSMREAARKRTMGRSAKYSYDRRFFNKIDTEEKAYILGLIFADGCNHKDSMNLVLAERDVDILRKIRGVWTGLPPLGRVTQGKSIRRVLKAHSKYLSEQLTRLGCTPRKSLTLKYPNQVPHKLTRHFIRGYVDGDGSLQVSAKGGRLMIMGTLSFCSSIQEIFRQRLEVPSYIHKVKKDDLWTVCRLWVYSRNALAVLNWLYGNSTIYMDRKYKKYQEICSYYSK